MNAESSSGTLKSCRPEREQIGQLEAQMRGYLIHPDDDNYDAARAVWNGMIDRRPALIARCAGAADLIAAVNFARGHAIVASVRGGGHNVAGSSTLCDDGLVIDLSDMRSVRVDPYRQTVRAEAGVRLGDLDREAQAFGLIVPSGIVTETGVGGLTIGGGLGWLSRAWGLTCDNLLSADIVTADGRLVHASDDENPDLFRAIRGGGGNFGIATSFEFCCYEFGPTALAGIVMYPIERASQLLRFYREYTATVPDKVTAFALLRRAPPAPIVPEEFHGAPICAIGACYAGPPEKGEAFIRPIKEWGAQSSMRLCRSHFSPISRPSTRASRQAPAITGSPITSTS